MLRGRQALRSRDRPRNQRSRPAPGAPPRRPCRAGSPCERAGRPVDASWWRRRTAPASEACGGPGCGRSRPARRRRAARAASCTTSSSTPLRRSSWASARGREAPGGVPALDPGVGERGVIDQPDLLEPVEQPGRYVVGDVALRELVGQLPARAGPAGQLVEQDGPRDRLRVGFDILGAPVTDRRPTLSRFRSHRSRWARRTGRRRACRPGGRPRASRGSASPARWRGRGCRAGTCARSPCPGPAGRPRR